MRRLMNSCDYLNASGNQYCNNSYNTDKLSFIYYRNLYTNRITILEPGTFKDLPRLASMYVYIFLKHVIYLLSTYLFSHNNIFLIKLFYYLYSLILLTVNLFKKKKNKQNIQPKIFGERFWVHELYFF